MKVAFFTDNLNLDNGWGNYALYLISTLEKRGIKPIIFITKGKSEKRNSRALLSSYYDNWRKNFLVCRDYHKIKNYFKDCDLIHVLSEPYSPLAYYIFKKLKIPYLITGHGTYLINPLAALRFKKIYSQTYQQAKQVICVSNFTKEELAKKIKLNNLTVIHNGIDYQKFSNTVHQKIGHPVKFLTVGAIKERKNQLFSLRVINSLKEEGIDLKYYIIGQVDSLSYLERIKEYIKEHQLSNQVEILTQVNDQELLNYYQESDIFVLTSQKINYEFEGFGLVFLEASASGLPSIGQLGTGAVEAIKDSSSGYVVSSEKEARDKILQLIYNQTLYQIMSSQALTWAQEHDWSKVVIKYLKFYD